MRIGVLCAFSAMVEHYSLTRIVVDQLRMAKRAGHHPVLIAHQNFSWPDAPEWVEVRAEIPDFVKIDYSSELELSVEHQLLVAKISSALTLAIADLDAVLAHDLIFTGWNLPINLAVRQLSNRPVMLHWVHSVPGGEPRDFWQLPDRSYIVYPNHSDRRRCAEHFHVPEEFVVVVPHPMDARDFLMTTDAAKFLANECGLMKADLIQTFPIPTDRAEAKGLDQVISVFGALKKLGYQVRLIVCNSWCTNKFLHDKVDDYRIKCRLAGLGDSDVAFTSKELKHFELGVPNAVVRDLMLVSNLFVYPTKSETFGLAIAEAGLSGQLLVLNSSLNMMPEIAGFANALYFNFGSYQQRVDCLDWDKFYSDVALIISRAYESNPALLAKTHFRKTYCPERIWGNIESIIVSGTHDFGRRPD